MSVLIGYAFKAKNAPNMREQLAALEEEGCVRVFEDEHPSRDARDDMIDNAGVRHGDTLVVAKSSVLGSGRADTMKVVTALADLGVFIKVVGQKALLHKEESDMTEFAEGAVKESRSANAQHMLATRQNTGRPAKWEMNDQERAILAVLWYDRRVPPDVVLEVASLLAGQKITRANMTLWMGKRDQSE